MSSEYVWRMEHILDLYAQEYCPQEPVICLDERPVQLLSDVQEPLPAKPGYKRRVDYEYHREGSCNLFMFFQPQQGWRHVKVTARRKKADFAHCLRDLVDLHFPDASKIHVVLDNLNTHTYGALYETFSPEEARRIAQRIDLHFTPKHGSWLNMVEIELSILSRQSLQQRIPDQTQLQDIVMAWSRSRNTHRATVEWRFSVHEARVTLASLYPT